MTVLERWQLMSWCRFDRLPLDQLPPASVSDDGQRDPRRASDPFARVRFDLARGIAAVQNTFSDRPGGCVHFTPMVKVLRSQREECDDELREQLDAATRALLSQRKELELAVSDRRRLTQQLENAQQEVSCARIIAAEEMARSQELRKQLKMMKAKLAAAEKAAKHGENDAPHTSEA